MFIKVFLASVVVLALLGCIGANQKENKKLAAGIAIVALILFTVVMVGGSGKKEDKPTAVAPESGKITVDQNQWGTITVTDRETGVTREYQGCIHISGSYPYATYEYMGLCVSMDEAIEIGEWSPGTYKLFYEDEETYWKMKEEQQKAETEAEKEKTDNE